MDEVIFAKWLKGDLIPTIPANSVIVAENNQYHIAQVDKALTNATRKQDIID